MYPSKTVILDTQEKPLVYYKLQLSCTSSKTLIYQSNELQLPCINSKILRY